jgi:pimeloyl-ACP methyl ester carboxylesterase
MTDDITWRSTDGLTLYARSYGPVDARLTVLCMHGLTRNHKDFEPMIEALGNRYRFIAVDVRGRGQSERATDPKTYNPGIYAGDMVALLNRLNIHAVALIGTSMGGLMSMLLSKMIPDRIHGVVLNDVGPVFETAGLARIASYVTEVKPVADWQTAADAVAENQKSIFPNYGPEDWMAFARRTFRELETGEVILDYDPEITKTLGEVKPGVLTRIAMWRLYKSMFPRPLLIIRGETSDILSEKTLQKMIQRHPDAKAVTVPGVGHAPILHEQEAVAGLSSFLARLEPTE